jgi:hypothetical protein
VHARIDRADRTPEFARGFDTGHPFQAAKHERRPHPIRQAVQLLVHDPGQFPVFVFGAGRHIIRQSDRPFRLEVQRGIHRDAVQPPGDGLPRADRLRVPGEGEEGCLEGIFDVVLVP